VSTVGTMVYDLGQTEVCKILLGGQYYCNNTIAIVLLGSFKTKGQ
jgi:hypothetical protein